MSNKIKNPMIEDQKTSLYIGVREELDKAINHLRFAADFKTKNQAASVLLDGLFQGKDFNVILKEEKEKNLAEKV